MEIPAFLSFGFPYYAGQKCFQEAREIPAFLSFKYPHLAGQKCFQEAREIPADQSFASPYFAGQKCFREAREIPAIFKHQNCPHWEMETKHFVYLFEAVFCV